MLFILSSNSTIILAMFPKASYANRAVDHLAQEKYLVFEGLICEKEGWSDATLKKVSRHFDKSRFKNIKAFYVLELQHLGIQVYRANNANPVSSIVLPSLFSFFMSCLASQDGERTCTVMPGLRPGCQLPPVSSVVRLRPECTVWGSGPMTLAQP